MAVHTHEENLKVLAMIFEARYDEGYRFLDHCGELLVRFRQKNPSWTVAALGQQTVSLVQKKDGLLINVGVAKFDASTTAHLTQAEADQQAPKLGRAAEEFYERTHEVLQISRTTRVATRFVFMAPSDSLEEADRFLLKASSSALRDAVATTTKSEPREAQFVYVVDDPESGCRRRVTLFSIILEQKPEDPPFLGLPGDSGSGGVVVDIDTYTRPVETHPAKTDVFVQENYLRTRSQAKEIFAWLLKQQK